MTSQDVYYEKPTVFEFPNMTVRVFRPVLTDEERARRMKEIKKAVVDLVLSQEKAKGGMRA